MFLDIGARRYHLPGRGVIAHCLGRASGAGLPLCHRRRACCLPRGATDGDVATDHGRKERHDMTKKDDDVYPRLIGRDTVEIAPGLTLRWWQDEGVWSVKVRSETGIGVVGHRAEFAMVH
jgi:hypothetical protein